MEGIQYLTSLAQWTGRGGFGIDKMRALMPILGNPQDQYPTFHIGGTNGKGSVASSLAAILGAQNKRTLLNISPHLSLVNERIVVDGVPIGDGLLDECLLNVKSAAESKSIELSHHEAITAAAFIAGKKLDIDYGVFEVGLGGRLDASNVIMKPEACAIVSIALDHEEILGNSVEKIAGEKSGIIKPNVPVVLGKLDQAAQWVIQESAKQKGSPTICYGEDFDIRIRASVLEFDSRNMGHFAIEPALQGSHQLANAAVAIALARNSGFSVAACKDGIKNVCWPARLETVRFSGSNCLIDAAHNVAGFEALTRYLTETGATGLEVVFGAVRTKRWELMVDVLAPFVARWHVLTPDFASAVPSIDVVESLQTRGYQAIDYDDNYLKVLDLMASQPSRSYLVTGSIYMIGKLRALMRIDPQILWTRKEL